MTKSRNRLLIVLGFCALLVVASARPVAADDTYTNRIWNCLQDAADSFHWCVMYAQDWGWFKRNAWEVACGITYGIDGVACLPGSVF